jgi:hypothetical protein
LPRCTKGHETPVSLTCQVCGESIDYEGSLAELSRIPHIKIKWEKVYVLYVGLPPFDTDNAYTLGLSISDVEEETENQLQVGRIDGGTWFDLYDRYRNRFSEWLYRVGFHVSRYRIVIIDTSNPLSVLTVSTISPIENTLLLAITADQSSTLVTQNTSFSALSVARKRALPIVLVSADYVNDLTLFTEDMGLISGTQTIGEIVSFLVSHIGEVMDFAGKDTKLGIQAHCLSAILSASPRVYRTIDDAFLIQLKQPSINVEPAKLQTAYLFAQGSKRLKEEIMQSFDRFYRGSQLSLLDAKAWVFENENMYGLYNLLMFYGLKDIDTSSLEKGYEVVVSKNPNLRVDKIYAD